MKVLIEFVDSMTYLILFFISFSFILTYYAIPPAIEMLRSAGNVVEDKYKKGEVFIPNQGGTIIIFVTIIVFTFITLWKHAMMNFYSNLDISIGDFITDIALLFVTVLFAVFGYVDDKVDIEHWIKIILPFFFAYPLLAIVTPEHLTLPLLGKVDFNSEISLGVFGNLQVYTISRLIIMPIFVIIIANMVNMHSGFNGLQSGCSLIILGSIIIKSVLDDRTTPLLVPSLVFGALLAFWYFNKYPSRIIEGNVGSFFIGSTIGSILVIQGYVIFGIVVFIPHILDFLMFTYVRISRKTFSKFGSIGEDGAIVAPDPLKLKFLLPYYFTLTEKQTVFYLHGITALFCIVGLIVV